MHLVPRRKIERAGAAVRLTSRRNKPTKPKCDVLNNLDEQYENAGFT